VFLAPFEDALAAVLPRGFEAAFPFLPADDAPSASFLPATIAPATAPAAAPPATVDRASVNTSVAFFNIPLAEDFFVDFELFFVVEDLAADADPFFAPEDFVEAFFAVVVFVFAAEDLAFTAEVFFVDPVDFAPVFFFVVAILFTADKFLIFVRTPMYRFNTIPLRSRQNARNMPNSNTRLRAGQKSIRRIGGKGLHD
jgi:hypothetical protein